MDGWSDGRIDAKLEDCEILTGAHPAMAECISIQQALGGIMQLDRTDGVRAD